MYLRYTLDAEGKRVYTMTKDQEGEPTLNAHPARFSPEDTFSEHRIRVKKRAGLLKIKIAAKNDVYVDSRMAVMHRALFVWVLILLFFIMLVLILDHRTDWNWFVVFVPMWIFDVIALEYVIFNIVMHLKNGHDRNRTPMQTKLVYLFCFLLKTAFGILLCLRLEYPEWKLHLGFVMLPLWILLIVLLTYLSKRLYLMIAHRPMGVRRS
ncbi:unnamed protein product [Notodromas monacha]|uniref:Nucleolar protein 10 n=1 Tax=Notodromas monacha TaxID=399045 RepID=A0A7R9GFP2_9CRUS|nr:unnamed protein product [Notodromas monacha]CAG0919090.1 unnamed protein product [Notodromas monacha]